MRRRVTLSLVALGLTAAWTQPADAATRSRGNFFVFDTPNCTGQGNSALVTVPFSVGGTNYPANTTMPIYATDLNTGEQFGPFNVTTNAAGQFCELVDRARETRWRIDLTEPGSGFTDTKVIRVQASPPVATTAAPATTSATTTTPASSSSTSSTAVGSTTSTSVPSPTTTVGVEVEPPIDLRPVEPPTVWPLPETGARSSGTAGVAAAALVAGAAMVLIARRRSPVGR